MSARRLAALCLLVLIIAALAARPSGVDRQGLERSQTHWNQPDAALGWVHMPSGGRYVYTIPARDSVQQVTVTLWPGGERATQAGDPPHDDPRPQLWVFGCSHTFGLEVSDEDTLPWQLQLRVPERRVRNFGVEAYGTYQALLALRQRLASEPPPAEAVYALADFHGDRNAGTYAWLSSITYAVSADRRVEVRMPYASLGRNGALREHAPEPMRRAPCDPASPLCRAADTLLNLDKWGRGRQAEITERLVERFIEECRAHGVRPVIVHLEGSAASHHGWQALCRRAGVDLVDVRATAAGEQRPRGKWLWHPDPAFHRRVAARLAETLAQPR